MKRLPRNPTTDRWLSPDPLGGDVTNPQSLNRYAYVDNNPASFTDPSGLHLVYGVGGYASYCAGGAYIAVFAMCANGCGRHDVIQTKSHDYAFNKSWIEFKAPNEQGVYWLRDKGGKTLFVGKGNILERLLSH